MKSEKTWTWLKSKGKIFKIISNPAKGTIEVLNEKGEILIRKTNLSRRQVENVEKNFLNMISKKSNENCELKSNQNFDPMIA